MNKPSFKYEEKLWRRGFKYIAGCDEVGRGCLAGPVVAGCVVFARDSVKNFADLDIPKIDDSKRLTLLMREKASKWIKENCLSWGIGIGSVSEINKKGIGKATLSAFRRAVLSVMKKSNIRVDYLLIDAFYVPYTRGLRIGTKNGFNDRKNPKLPKDDSRQLAIIKGDEKSFSIASASIIAKVYRDNLMLSLSKRSKYKKYGWDKNKGYGTRAHQEAILTNGATRYHRLKFLANYMEKHRGVHSISN